MKGVHIRIAALAVIALSAAACQGSTETSADPLAALPKLSDFPAGYSMLGEPRQFDAADQTPLPGVGPDMKYSDEACRVLIETPAGKGVGEAVSSSARAAVYMVQIVESDLRISDVDHAIGQCATIEGSSPEYSIRASITPLDKSGDDTPESVGYRASTVQTVRGDDGRVAETPMVQERLVARVGDHVVTASVTIQANNGDAVSETGIDAESPVLRSVFDRTLERLDSP